VQWVVTVIIIATIGEEL